MTPSEFNDFAALFRTAEQRLKEIEHLTNVLAIPAINELRYAGFHAVQAMAADSPEERRERIREGEKHCKRAVFDVAEIGIAYYLEGIALFQGDYRLVPIGSAVPDYLDCLEKARAAQEFLGSNSLHDKDVDWDGALRHYNSLKGIFHRLEDARPELNKVLRNWRIGLIISLALLTVGVAGLIARAVFPQ